LISAHELLIGMDVTASGSFDELVVLQWTVLHARSRGSVALYTGERCPVPKVRTR